MTSQKTSKSTTLREDQYLEALYEKDRLNYAGRFVEGFVHNINGPLQNLTGLAQLLSSNMEEQDGLFRRHSGENEEWSALLEKQRKRLTQILEQIYELATDSREFMQLYEIERIGTEVDINALLTRMVKVFRADHFFKHKVQYELRLAKNLLPIKVLGKDLVPAVFHLFQNSLTALKNSAHKTLIVETSMQGAQITIRITDSGCGLPEGVDPHILFDLFESRWQKSDNTAASSDRHLGFGLYAARQLLLPYGFEVSLEKTPEGTSASIRVPVNKKAA